MVLWLNASFYCFNEYDFILGHVTAYTRMRDVLGCFKVLVINVNVNLDSRTKVQ